MLHKAFKSLPADEKGWAVDEAIRALRKVKELKKDKELMKAVADFLKEAQSALQQIKKKS